MARSWCKCLPLVLLLAAPGAGSSNESGGREEGAKMSLEEMWRDVDERIEDQRFEAASERTLEILERARDEGDEKSWTRALIREVQLRTALHGYATGVKFLSSERWPESARSRSILEIFQAHGLTTYLQAYSWEIAQRELVVTGDDVDLESWTRDQIVAAANEAFDSAWGRRESWGGESIGELAEYIQQNDYPARIRGTLRDAMTYLWVDLLANSEFWRPEHESGIYRLDLASLLGEQSRVESDLLTDGAVHPMVKIVYLLDDLERWHRAERRPEAAFEARLERLRRLGAVFSRADDRESIRADLELRLDELGREFEWWSVGMAELARALQAEDRPTSLIDALEVAREGRAAHLDSLGGERCGHIAEAIERPSYRMSAMRVDGAARRSIQVEHQGVRRLHLRAYELDLASTVMESEDYNPLPAQREVPRLLAEAEPALSWMVDLPPTDDYRTHRTFITPPIERPGLYVVVASMRQDFAESTNRLASTNLIVSDLVLLTRREPSAFDVTVRSGATGRVVEGVEVRLIRSDWRKGHRAVAAVTTGDDGRVRFETGADRRDRFVLLAERGEDAVVDLNPLRPMTSPESPPARTAALVYTDRAVYRPGQTLHWKVVGYSSDGAETRFATLPETAVVVRLRDGNGEEVAQHEGSTNEFGSLAGEFEIPTGRLLGGWYLETSLGGGSTVRVEEYKRPTFEVAIEDPAEPMRLNRAASLTGSARYYFGLPLTDGEVTWRIVREPVYPRWWGAWAPQPRGSSETVASGDATVSPEGTFEIDFTPEADEREATPHEGDRSSISYRFRLTAEVTDPGGETRTASRVFRLGFVAVEAAIDRGVSFLRAGSAAALPVMRTDLDGLPRTGLGRWRLLEVVQPAEARLPAEEPRRSLNAEAEAFQTPGDRLQPRWAEAESPLQAIRRWDAGDEVLSGTVRHDLEGRGVVRIPALVAGVYRLRYETEDPFGETFELSEDLVVAADASTPLTLPAALLLERSTVPVGGTARLLVHSALAGQEMVLEIVGEGGVAERRTLSSEDGARLIEIPIREDHRGGLGFRLTALRDHQLMTFDERLRVPRDDRELAIELATFRDLLRPGQRESWRVVVRGSDESTVAAGTAELLAYMYDRSLDLFATHSPPQPPGAVAARLWTPPVRSSLGQTGESWTQARGLYSRTSYPSPRGDRLKFFDGYPIGGPGGQVQYLKSGIPAPAASRMADSAAAMPESAPGLTPSEDEGNDLSALGYVADSTAEAGSPEEPPTEIRTDFSETAFWTPHLLTDEDGAAVIEFTVPESVTEWNLWVHALTNDIRAGSVTRRVRTVKELMVRPYLPRFLREGDRAAIRVVVQNAGEEPLEGRLDLEIVDPETEASLLGEFGLEPTAATDVAFAVEPGEGATLEFDLEAPQRVGAVAFRVTARAGDLSDGELRALPLLPGRVHLSQSRFVALHDAGSRRIEFEDLTGEDPSRIDEQMVVTLDAQLFSAMLRALPYLTSYPYSCTEQTLNRFVSTGVMTSLFDEFPAVAAIAAEMGARETAQEPWNEDDPNRKIVLEESPWLRSARGGGEPEGELIRLLDPEVAAAERRKALAELAKAQTSLGAFPWWPGGPPSPYMTLYVLEGLSRAIEFGVEVPREVVAAGWRYLHRHYLDEVARGALEQDCCWELITWLNHVLDGYPDPSWTGGVFTVDDRKAMLEFSLANWRRHSPRLKGYLALTLYRQGREEEARRVFESVMDSAKSDPDLGTYWAPEERAWLWYNDSIESHATTLRTLGELSPNDDRRHGLAQWLFLNRKLNHWKSTRATAEVLYSLARYLKREGALAVEERATVTMGGERRTYTFAPDSLAPAVEGDGFDAVESGPGSLNKGTPNQGAPNQWWMPGPFDDPAAMSTVVVEKETPGFLFASATWHFSTETLPEASEGGLFSVERRYFRRVHDGRDWTLEPLADEALLEPGDQVEVQLTIRARHAAEYVHLRDPRPAGFEPETQVSGYRWDLGLGRFEEIRDSGANFFIDWLPNGEYTLKHRLRATHGGSFRAAPAVLQSIYAPEFTAYSSGRMLEIEGAGGDD